MKKWILPVLGMALILGSLCWMLVLEFQTRADVTQCQTVAGALEAILPERKTGLAGDALGMPILEIDGVDYAALLEVAGFGLRLPVEDGWNGGQGVPARFSGSTYGNDLILAGRDDPQIFGFCSQVDLGQRITITDMTGAEFTYTVVRVDRAQEARRDWLEGWDLTLFCHAAYSMEYVAVRCEAVYG